MHRHRAMLYHPGNIAMKLALRVFAIASLLASLACTQESATEQVAPYVPIIAAVRHRAPAAGGSAAGAVPAAAPVTQPVRLPVLYLSDLLGHARFAATFNGLEGAGPLPAWTRDGGTNTAMEAVTVDGRNLLAGQGCKPHDCGAERLVLVYDEKTYDMWGVFARAPSDQSEAVESSDELTWLGQPDDALKAELKRQLHRRE